ncbi:hypothetical protein BH10CHL1_BH10CHL1_10420 [soil metagenome]
MNRLFRTFLFLPALILALVVVPVLALSGSFSWTAHAASIDSSAYYAGTISPLPTPHGTVPRPTPVRRPHRPHFYPTATPFYVAPTATPTAVPSDTGYANGHRLKKVIGDRLSNVIYGYTTDNELYRSPDDGATWNLVTSSPQVDDFIMNAADPNVLYSGVGAGCTEVDPANAPMYKSTNGGLTWVALPDSANKRPLLSNQGDPNSLFAADCKAPYVTTDGGQTWTARPDPSSEALWDTYHVVDMTAASLLGDPQPDKPNWDQIFAGGVSADGSGVVAFTNDQGQTWVRLTPKVEPASWGMTAIAADPFIEGLIGFVEPKGVWSTENYGVDWKFTTDGLQDVLNNSADGSATLNDIVHHPNNQFYVATIRGLYTKLVTDKQWTKIADTLYDNTAVTGLLFTESNPGVLWLNTADGVYTYSIPIQ